MKVAALLAIRFYKSYISPHKGFSCAYRVVHGGPSCSSLGYRAIRMHGLLKGMAVLRDRGKRCALANQTFRDSYRFANKQRGDCDCDIADCGDSRSSKGNCLFDVLAESLPCSGNKNDSKRKRSDRQSG